MNEAAPKALHPMAVASGPGTGATAGPAPGSTTGIDTDGFAAIARRAALGREDLIRRGHAPDGTRRLRRFPLWELSRFLIPLPPAEIRAELRACPALPQGTAGTPQSPPDFAFDEVLALRAHFAAQGRIPAPLARPPGETARTLAVANFKGGVGKTSTAAAAAMAAALEGLRVLVVDLDSQGSMTALLGARVADEWQTAFAAVARDFARELAAAGQPLDETLARAAAIDPAGLIQPTHWPGIDLLGAELNLYWAEFQIPVWRMRHRAWPLWDALGRHLEGSGALAAYDLVVIDTPPALGYLTINALAAADILLVPLGASYLEFESTGRFLDMIATSFASIEAGEAASAAALGLAPARFEWDAVRLLLTRYDAAQQAEMAAFVEAWFGPAMARHRQELTALVGQAGEGARAIHEVDPRDVNRETYLRGRETYERSWAEIRALIAASWARGDTAGDRDGPA